MESAQQLQKSYDAYRRNIITDEEYVLTIIYQILDGRLSTIKGVEQYLPCELAGKIMRAIQNFEKANYVDVFSVSRFETMEERRERADQFRDQYIVVLGEIREFY